MAGSCAGTFFAVEPNSGDPIWSYDVTLHGDASSFHGNMFLTDNLVVIANDGMSGAQVFAFDQETGRPQWLHPIGRGGASDVVGDSGSVYLVTREQVLLALDATTGDERWSLAGGLPAEPVIIGSTPFVQDRTLYFGSLSGELFALDAKTGTDLWQIDLQATIRTALLLHAGSLFVATQEGRFLRLQADTGEVISETTIDSLHPGAHALIHDDRYLVYLAANSSASTLAAFDLSLQLRWQRPAPEGYWSTVRPLVDGDVVLAGTSSGLLCELSLQDGSLRAVHQVDPEKDWSMDNVRVIGTHAEQFFVGTIGGTLYAFRHRAENHAR